MPDASLVLDQPRGRVRHIDFDRLSTLLVLLWLLAVLPSFPSKWIAHDEGLLGECARRALAGEIPHLDFQDSYTGGLTYLHALAFRLFGANLVVLRWFHFVVFAIAMLCLFRVALRWVRPREAAILTVVASAWGAPGYAASMPSWYNLYAAIGALLCLLAFDESGHRRWVFVAGVLCGWSFWIKVTGLYSIIASLLALALLDSGPPSEPRRSERAERLLALVVVALVPVFLLIVLHSWFDFKSALYFWLPTTLLSIVVWTSIRRRSSSPCPGWLVFAVGVVMSSIPAMALFAARNDAFRPWLRGVFVLPSLRMEFATFALPPWSECWFALVPLAMWIRARVSRDSPPRPLARGWTIALAVGACLLVVGFGARPTAYRLFWGGMRAWIPLLSAMLTVEMLRGPGAGPSLQELGAMKARNRAAAVMSFAALVSVIQFPFAGGIYFLYVAPLCFLALVVFVNTFYPANMPLVWAYLAVAGVFGFTWNDRGHVAALGLDYIAEPPHRLAIPNRLGLRVGEADAAVYERLVAEIEARTGPGDFIYAGPDAPEVYFLSARRNPFPWVFDFFKEEPGYSWLPRALLDRSIRMVVINTKPRFSDRVEHATLAELEASYRPVARIGSFVLLDRSTAR